MLQAVPRAATLFTVTVLVAHGASTSLTALGSMYPGQPQIVHFTSLRFHPGGSSSGSSSNHLGPHPPIGPRGFGPPKGG